VGGVNPEIELIPETIWQNEQLDIGEYDSEDDELWDDEIEENYLNAPAYTLNEPSPRQMAYLQSIINNSVKHMSVKDTDQNLAASITMLDVQARALNDLAQQHGLEIPPPLGPPPVTTTVGARRRLGIDTKQHIIPYAACPTCWKLHTPRQMQELDSLTCPVPGCNGVIYEIVTLKSKKPYWRANLIVPQVPLLRTIRRMMRRKGFARRMRDSRDTPVNDNDNPMFKMKDMHDGEMWHDLKTNIRREVGDQGTVRDVECEGGAKRLTEHRLGLHITINIDWCTTFISPTSILPLTTIQNTTGLVRSRTLLTRVGPSK
jgi:hypothetical protein